MKPRSKRYRQAFGTFDATKRYRLADAFRVLKAFPKAKFDEAVELHFQLGIDPAQADQGVRFSVMLPHGVGKTVRVVCFCKGEEAQAAEAKGAVAVGGEELVEKILGGWMDFDCVVAHPDLMRVVSKLGRVLGPRGLMPSPKSGTVTPAVAQAVEEAKRGKLDFKADKTAGLHARIGKLSFDDTALIENAQSVVRALLDHKPSASKGDFVRSASLAGSQSPGIQLDVTALAS